MSASTRVTDRTHAATVLARLAGMASGYAAIATFVLVFYFTFQATQAVAGDTVTNLITDAPLWIWLTATVCAGVVASAKATVQAAVSGDDRPSR